MEKGKKMKSLKILIDIGSTFTKAVAIDLENETLLSSARAPTTASEDVTIGIGNALKSLAEKTGRIETMDITACSSAAGGLRMVSIGLVPELSSEAAKRAALGAGAKIVGHYSHHLSGNEIRRIENTSADLILLAGGTDGGNEKVILHNAAVLANSAISAPIIVAGNKSAYDEIERIFSGSGKTITFVKNVMPELGKLKVRDCREAIRETFMKNIIHAKGLDKAMALVTDIIMPTPVAVLNAAVLLSRGINDEQGLGEIIVVDVGGATTDVYSIARGTPKREVVILRGLPEPFSKRTVEGDLGVRHNIANLLEIAETRGIAVDGEIVSAFHANPGNLPVTQQEKDVDAALARIAVEASFERHVGTLEMVYGPHGPMLIQKGKDLSEVTSVIGTGGPIIHGAHPETILSGILSTAGDENSLKPSQADFFLDSNYIMYAIGLLAQSEPEAALRFGKKYLLKI
jgi:uncharacterized protein (TIGR01319 family)